MNPFFKYKFLLIIVLIFSSCEIDDLNLEQIKDYSSTRVFRTSLAYFTVNQKDFLDSTTGTEITVPVSESAGFLFFINNPPLRSNLEKIEIEIEMNNQFNRDFVGKVQFLDSNDNITQNFNSINVKAKNSLHKQTLTLLIADNIQFLNSEKVRFELELQPSVDGSMLDPNVEQTLNFKSVGIYYIKGEFND